MEYIALIERTPIVALWFGPLLVLGFVGFMLLLAAACLHDLRSAARDE